MSVKTNAARTLYRFPQLAIGRFVARRTLRSATLWALVFGVYVASKAVGYAAAYPTAQERVMLAKSFGSNAGLSAVLGAPHHMETVAGFTTWNCLGVMAIVGGIWAFLLATKTFRGEEQNGRLELLLTGQTTARRAAVNILAGLGVSLLVLYTVAAVVFVAVGKAHTVHFGTSAALFLALCVVSSAAMFIAVGALTSQLMPTRSRAAAVAAAIFGLFFLLRAVADSTSATWLLNITPLGWIERARPLYDSQAIWLLPCLLFVLLTAGVAVFIAGRRDLGESTFADRESARPRYALLSSPLGVALRLTRASSIGWIATVGAVALMFGLLTGTASQALAASSSAAHTFDRLAHTPQTIGASAFLGVIFLMIMTCIMAYAASAAGAMREDEARGYLDNFLVRPVGRIQWLVGRVGLAVGVVVLAGLAASLGSWLGELSQHVGVSLQDLLLAGVNAMVPAALVLGIGICVLGVVPRIVTVLTYGVIAWSFLIQMLSSGLNLNHWLVDTSILHHIALVPASSINWKIDGIFVLLAALLALVGSFCFRRRDLQVE